MKVAIATEIGITYIPAIFSLKWPCRVIKTLRENLVQLNLSGADKVIRGDSIVVPNSDIDLTKAFNEGKHKLLLKNRVFSTIWNQNWRSKQKVKIRVKLINLPTYLPTYLCMFWFGTCWSRIQGKHKDLVLKSILCLSISSNTPLQIKPNEPFIMS